MTCGNSEKPTCLHGNRGKPGRKQPGPDEPEPKRRVRELAGRMERLAKPFKTASMAPALPTAQWCAERGLNPDDVCRLVEDVGWRAPEKIYSWKYFMPELLALPGEPPDRPGRLKKPAGTKRAGRTGAVFSGGGAGFRCPGRKTRDKNP